MRNRLLTKRAPKAGSVGLDIDGSMIAAVHLVNGRVQHAASAELPAGVMVDGEVADGEGLSEVLKAFFKRERLPEDVRLGVANSQIQVRHVDLPPIADAKERDAAVRFQAAEAIAMPIDDVVIDYESVAREEMPGGNQVEHFVLVAARETMVMKLVEAVRAAGLRPEGVDLNAFALVRTLAPTGLGTPRAYLHLGGVTQLAMAAGSTCLFTRTLAASWGDGQAVDVLADEMRLSIDYYRAQPRAPHIDELVLSGPGVRDGALAPELGEWLDLQASSVDPLGDVPPADFPGAEDPYRHTISVGLALGGAA